MRDGCGVVILGTKNVLVVSATKRNEAKQEKDEESG